jgi:hypothetical protein
MPLVRLILCDLTTYHSIQAWFPFIFGCSKNLYIHGKTMFTCWVSLFFNRFTLGPTTQTTLVLFKWSLLLSQPHFEARVRMRLALPKVRTWSPPRLLKFQSSIAEVKTPRLEMFFIPLKRSWSVNVENGLT